jgi:glucose/arabinose dehydrogenase
VPPLRSRSLPGRITIAAVVLALLLGSAPSGAAGHDPTSPPAATDEARLDRPSKAGPDPQIQALELAQTGFLEQVVISGLDAPTAVEFAPNGHVFVAEKRGTIQEFDSLTDTTPSEWADISGEVHDYWDRGLLGMALDPSFASNGRIYVAYAYDDAGWDDQCPTPPGDQTDGCVIHGRVSALTSDGSEQVLVEDWCQQFPSHDMSDIVFDSEGALIVGGGEGANFNNTDWGQFGGSLSGTPTPRNPCGDPPGGAMAPPSAEGGALRSQDRRTTGDTLGLSGTIIRINRFTGAAMPDNPVKTGSTNMRRIVAYGLRNPFRIAVQPSTDDLWIGDVGWETFEEIDRTDPDGTTVPNFGWPCREGSDFLPAGYDALTLCQTIGTGWRKPHFAYNQGSELVAGDGCGNGGTISGLAFYNGGAYPASFDGALFFTDYTRECLWVMPPGTNGTPSVSAREKVLTLTNPVQLTTGPGGDLFYVDIGGTIKRITYVGSNRPPVARVSANPTSGSAPLLVQFNASASTDPDGNPLTFSWDLDGDGGFGDASGPTPSTTYDAGSRDVTVRVTDGLGGVDTATVAIDVDNARPVAIIDQPTASFHWTVGQTINFAGHNTDGDDGTLPASAFSWQVVLLHCTTVCHEHPISTFNGVKSGSFPAPDHDYPSYLELRLTVDDGDGGRNTAVRRLDPKAVSVQLRSVPGGLSLRSGTQTGTTPFSVTVIAGSSVQLSAPSPQTRSGDTYLFQKWSDGGAQTHNRTMAANGTFTATYVGFTDIDTSIFENDILWLALNEITQGCSATQFCPSAVVTREQMASFLARALHLPVSSRDFFTDDNASQHEGDINRIAAAGITGGCAANRYCPSSPVSRGQMAAFLHRAFKDRFPS